jgi:hypothetical protein
LSVHLAAECHGDVYQAALWGRRGAVNRGRWPHRTESVVYIGVGTLVLIIILVLLLT